MENILRKSKKISCLPYHMQPFYFYKYLDSSLIRNNRKAYTGKHVYQYVKHVLPKNQHFNFYGPKENV
jgi:hypothetical protein